MMMKKLFSNHYHIEGTYENSLGLATLSAVLFHFMINITGELIEATARAEFLQVSLLIVTAIMVIIV